MKIGKKYLHYEGKTVEDIVRQFIKDYRDIIDPKFIQPNGLFIDKNLIFLNGRDIDYLDKYETKLKEGDRLMISWPLNIGLA
jgi:molybdopterin converting factor small subunit